MSEQTLCFVNSLNAEKIIVADADSAATLQKLLAALPGSPWVRESERPAVAPVAPVAAPAVIESHGKELRVILISGTSTYRCATCGVLEGGVQLKSAVPASFDKKQCVAYISHDDMRENLEISCQVVTDSNGLSRLEFVKSSPADLEKLTEWTA